MPVLLLLTIALSQTELPPEARLTPEAQAPQPPSAITRALLSTGGGVLASGLSLGVTWLLVEPNPKFDAAFATAALSTLMVTGISFAIHQALGGHGEVTLSLLFTALLMAGSAGIVAVIEHDPQLTPVLITAIGALPAAAAATLALELTTPDPKRRHASIWVGPTSLRVAF